MTDLINTPTYFQGNYSSSLDDIIVTNKEYHHSHGTIGTCDSNHVLVYTTRKKAKIFSEPAYIHGRTFTKFNPILFQCDCIFADWTSVLCADNGNEAGDRFLIILHNLLDKHAPLKEVNISTNLHHG